MAEIDLKEVLKPFYQRASEAEVRRKSIRYKLILIFPFSLADVGKKHRTKTILKRLDSASANFLSNQTPSFILICFDIYLYDYTMLYVDYAPPKLCEERDAV